MQRHETVRHFGLGYCICPRGQVRGAFAPRPIPSHRMASP
ncbi:hypothetical protein BRUCa_0593 [Brucella melitensis]